MDKEKRNKMKFDKICMNCGKKFKKLKLRVIKNEENNYRDFCSIDCLIKYYQKCKKQRN